MFHRDNPSVPIGPLVDTCHRMIQEGKIHAWGASNWSPQRLQAALDYATKTGKTLPVASSPNFSLAKQIDSPWGDDCVTISGPDHAEDRAWYAQSDLAVMTWSSLARGFLTGRLTRENFDTAKEDFEEHTIRCYVCEENWQRIDRALAVAKEFDLTLPQVALAFVLNQDFDAYALVGARDDVEMASNLAALQAEIPLERLQWMDAVE